ncbi:MAG: class I SAM-dependent methyltransferase [Thiovulaceae bacterium]|nr:class I SAM-dependent methyltransferase [Sulfurimonadaceae bacterium]
MHFTHESMLEILELLKEKLQESDEVSFEVLNPDIADGTYAGEIIELEGRRYLYRSLKAWSDLAQLLFCKMRVPEKLSDERIRVHFIKLNTQSSFHTKKVEKKQEKYGLDSHFFNIHKNEEPVFIEAYSKALKSVGIEKRNRILNLGINRADEFEVIESLVDDEVFAQMDLVGIDHSQTAIEEAQKRFVTKCFYTLDLNNMNTLDLGKFDLIISIGTLQSPSINFKLFFNSLVQNYLNPNGAMILGFPNSRWLDGEMVYGAKMPNYSDSDLSLVIGDIHYCKKYLQQKKFRVRITGRDYLFLTATKIS